MVPEFDSHMEQFGLPKRAVKAVQFGLEVAGWKTASEVGLPNGVRDIKWQYRQEG